MRNLFIALAIAAFGFGGSAFAANAEPSSAGGSPPQDAQTLQISAGAEKLCTACMQNMHGTGGAQVRESVGQCLDGDVACRQERARANGSDTNSGPTGI